MAEPVIYGPAYSTYARSARLALEEKGAKYKLVEVDALKGEAKAPQHLARHPFGKVPAFEHDGFIIYETSAIERYIDDALPGPKLTPADVKQRARMNQAIAVIDNYTYATAVGGLVMNRLVAPMLGQKPDEQAIANALPAAEKALGEIQKLMGANPYIAGQGVSLADLHLVPIMAYVTMTPEGEKMLGKLPALAKWWERMKARPSVQKTAPKF